MGAWKQQRAAAIDRDGCRCQICRTSEGLTVHHKVPWYISRDDGLDNLITLCRTCHDGIEQLDQVSIILSWAPLLRGY
jgi:5-methylcytosine-specific restriction endonuclease McrA